jgi:hypothetical protein
MRIAASSRQLAAVGVLSVTLMSPPAAPQPLPQRGVINEEPLVGRVMQASSDGSAASLPRGGAVVLMQDGAVRPGHSTSAPLAWSLAAARRPATTPGPAHSAPATPRPTPRTAPARAPAASSSSRRAPATRAAVGHAAPVVETARRFTGVITSVPGTPGVDRGEASTYGPGYGDLIAVPHRGRWLVKIIWRGRYVIRRTSDYGPDQQRYPNRVIDLDVATFQALSGQSWTRGILSGVTVEYLQYLGA